MLKNISRTKAIVAWVAAVVAVMAFTVVEGVHITVGGGVLWFIAGIVPPAVMLVLWHGAPPVSIGQLLYSVEKEPKEGRR